MIWKQTFTGRAVDMLAPSAADIDRIDVAHALALINRYDGHTRLPLSVAEHSLRGADALLAETGSRRLALLFLLHDAHEAYVGDVGTPVQQALAALCPEAGQALRELRRRFDMAIHAAFRVPLPEAGERAIVKTMDLRMLKAERDAVMNVRPQDWHPAVEAAEPIPSLRFFPVGTGWVVIEEHFLARLDAWTPAGRPA